MQVRTYVRDRLDNLCHQQSSAIMPLNTVLEMYRTLFATAKTMAIHGRTHASDCVQDIGPYAACPVMALLHACDICLLSIVCN